MRFAHVAICAALLVAGCGNETEQARQPDPAPDRLAGAGAAPSSVSEPSPVATGSPSPAPAERRGSDRVMQGDWMSKTMAGDPAALFGEPQTEAAFSIRCAGGELVLTRSLRHDPGPVTMEIMAAGETRAIEAISSPDPMPTVTGRLDASGDFAAKLMTSREPIAVRVADGASFRMPASEEVRRLVRACRG